MRIRQSFGLNVRRFRIAKGWSQESLGDAAGLHRTYISGIERGVRNPTLLVVEKVANALGVPPSALLAEAKGK
jgi:transcriptional regulator with XRE-family HTH domain